jgi:hypothetical protein
MALLAVVAALVGGIILGITWHKPKRMDLPDNIRTWVGFVIVIIGAAVALWQLDMQRRQLADQQRLLEGEVERNKRRDQLLDAQLDELEQRKRALEREQADKVGLSFSSTTFESRYVEDGELPGVAPGEVVHMAVISNGSHRSIRDVRCRWGTSRDDEDISDILGPPSHSSFAVVVGRLPSLRSDARTESRELGLLEGVDRARLIRAGQSYGFVFEILIHHVLIGDGISARFTDDAGLHWQIDHEMHLTKLNRRDW